MTEDNKEAIDLPINGINGLKAIFTKLYDEIRHSRDESDCALREMLMMAKTERWAMFDDNVFLYSIYFEIGDFMRSREECMVLLRRLNDLCPEIYADISKGTPFYFMGICSFFLKDYETAIFYIDAAVSEDMKAQNGIVGASYPPAIKFIFLDESGHLAGSLIPPIREKIQESIASYNNTRSNSRDGISIDNIVEWFLKPLVLDDDNNNYRSLPTAFLSFFLEWDDKIRVMRLITTRGTSEPFFLHLLKGSLLFESILKANKVEEIKGKQNKTGVMLPPTLRDALHCLCKLLEIDNDIKISAHGFSEILTSLKGSDRTVQNAITHTGKVRNTLGHNLGWAVDGLCEQTYNRLANDIAISCLHAIARLYKPTVPKCTKAI